MSEIEKNIGKNYLNNLGKKKAIIIDSGVKNITYEGEVVGDKRKRIKIENIQNKNND